MYVFIPVVDYLNELFPTSGPYAETMMFLWSILAVVNLFSSGIKFVMMMQKRGVDY